MILAVDDPYANHNGGGLAFGPDGMLYVALGDGGSAGDPLGNGQNVNALLGKILRLDVSGATYTVPPGNPLIGSGRGEIWAYGLRNPWRITFDNATGDLWAGDVGQGAWEEVNEIVRGGNYGWNITEGPDCFRADECDRAGILAPRASYGHDDGCSITGGYVYRGTAMPELAGWYLYSDYCSGRVWALDTSSDTSEPVELIDGGAPVSSFGQDAQGELYLVTFDREIQRIERAD
jgi:glucose/arabinose dehydrogenase